MPSFLRITLLSSIVLCLGGCPWFDDDDDDDDNRDDQPSSLVAEADPLNIDLVQGETALVTVTLDIPSDLRSYEIDMSLTANGVFQEMVTITLANTTMTARRLVHEYRVQPLLTARPGRYRLTATPSGISPTGGAADVLDGLVFVEVFELDTPAQPTATPTSVAAGFSHSLAALADGTVWGWGNNSFGEVNNSGFYEYSPTLIDGVDNVMQVAAGDNTSYALLGSGAIVAWGVNELGQLGLGNTQSATAPQPVLNISGVEFIDAGANFVLALLNDRRVMSWGSNNSGQLGRGLSEEFSADAGPITGLPPIVDVSAGSIHAIALDNAGGVWVWGDGRFGTLGDGVTSDTNTASVPQQIAGISTAVAVKASTDTSMVLLEDGTVLAFGGGTFGALGLGNTDLSAVPTMVPNVSPVSQIFADSRSASVFYQQVGGTVLAVGKNDDNQLQRNVGSSATTVGPANLPTQFEILTSSLRHVLALQRDSSCGAVWSWGGGAIGDGYNAPRTRTEPAIVEGLGTETCINLTTSANNSGVIFSSPSGIDCPDGSCSAFYAPGTTVTLDVANNGAVFLGFGGDCAADDGSLNTTLPLVVELDEHRYCPASFAVLDGPDQTAPMAVFTASPTGMADVDTPLDFDASGSSDADGVISLYEWDFENDGTVDATGVNVTHSYPVAGSYQVTLTVTDDDGLADSIEQTLLVNSPASAAPMAAFFTSPASPVVAGTNVTFIGSDSTDDVAITDYSWDFTDDGTYDATGETANNTYNTVGTYNVRLRVTDADSQTDEALQTITITAGSGSPTFYTLEVTLTGAGTANVNPPNLNLPDGSACDGDTCFLTDMAAGTVITITGQPQAPATLANWMGCDSVSGAECTVTMDDNRSVSVNFQ